MKVALFRRTLWCSVVWYWSTGGRKQAQYTNRPQPVWFGILKTRFLCNISQLQGVKLVRTLSKKDKMELILCPKFGKIDKLTQVFKHAYLQTTVLVSATIPWVLAVGHVERYDCIYELKWLWLTFLQLSSPPQVVRKQLTEWFYGDDFRNFLIFEDSVMLLAHGIILFNVKFARKQSNFVKQRTG